MKRRISLTWCLPLLAVTSCASRERPRDASYPLFRIETRDHEFRASSRLQVGPEGFVRVRLVNHGAVWHEALIVRLTSERYHARDYVDSVRAGADFPGFAIDLGGPGLTVAGDSSEIVVPLLPGRYALACWFAGHVRQGMVHDFEVVGTPESDAGGGEPRVRGRSAGGPPADLVLTMFDYNFDVSRPLTAGEHVLRVENRGPQPHEIDFFRLLPGRSPADYLAWSKNGRQGAAPALPVGGTLDFAPGHFVWLSVTFAPGQYFAICHVPDALDGRPHHDHGMVKLFQVE